MKFINKKRELEEKIEKLITEFEELEEIHAREIETWISDFPGSVGSRRIRVIFN